MKTIQLWDPRFPDRTPTRLSVVDALASAAVRAGVAAAVDPADYAVLRVGAAVDASDPIDVIVSNGPAQEPVRVTMPRAVAEEGALAGVVAGVDGAITGVTPPPGFLILVDSTGAVELDSDGAIFVEPA